MRPTPRRTWHESTVLICSITGIMSPNISLSLKWFNQVSLDLQNEESSIMQCTNSSFKSDEASWFSSFFTFCFDFSLEQSVSQNLLFWKGTTNVELRVEAKEGNKARFFSHPGRSRPLELINLWAGPAFEIHWNIGWPFVLMPRHVGPSFFCRFHW